MYGWTLLANYALVKQLDTHSRCPLFRPYILYHDLLLFPHSTQVYEWVHVPSSARVFPAIDVRPILGMAVPSVRETLNINRS